MQGNNTGLFQARVIRETLAHVDGASGVPEAGSYADAAKEPKVTDSVLLLDLLYAPPSTDLSALADYVVQLDNLSHVLAWTRDTQATLHGSATYAAR